MREFLLLGELLVGKAAQSERVVQRDRHQRLLSHKQVHDFILVFATTHEFLLVFVVEHKEFATSIT